MPTNRLDQQIGALAKDTLEFENDPDIQVRAIQLLQEAWKGLTPDAKGGLLAHYSTIFPRSCEDEFPEECLANIIKLPTPDDIHRALRVRQEMYRDWKCGEGEGIYPTTGWFGRFLSYAKHNKVPTPMYFWAALAVLGVACRRNFMYAGFDRNYRLSNYIFLTGPKGAGKSGARAEAIGILQRANRKIVEMKEQTHDIRVRDIKSYLIPIFGSDVTAASLVEKLAEHCNHQRLTNGPNGAPQEPRPGESVAIIDSDELGTFLGRDSHAVGTKVPMLTEMAFADYYRKSTKKGGEENAERLALSILACTAPEWMHETITGDALTGGFLDRVILVHREKSIRWWPRAQTPLFDPVEAEKLADWLVELMVRFPDNHAMLLTSEAQEYCDRWETEIYEAGQRDADDSSKHSLERLSLHVVKVAALLCIAEWDHTDPVPWIEARHVEQSVQLLEAEEVHREEFMIRASESSDEPTMRMMLKFLRDNGGEVSKSKFSQHGRFKRMDHQKREYMIAGLVARGDLILVRKMGDNNRLREFYKIPEGKR